MEVQLYVYDLSKGLARQFSLALTGIQIDAIYHTSIVFGGVEYFFGQGIHRKRPGSTHHGQPMEILKLGQTDLPADVIEEYLESLEEIYSHESYDLFLHNCNNFTQDLAMFVVGKAIPENIRTLPERFLNTPFGQMMKPQIDNALRGFAQGPEMARPTSRGRMNSTAPIQTTQNGVFNSTNNVAVNGAGAIAVGKVHNVTTLRELDDLLAQASKSCAVIFFTSTTCPPCKIVYPAYDQLAEEFAGKATLIKVDTHYAYEVASKYAIRATPTFMSFLRGEKENEWLGADEGKLRANVRLLVQMTWPPHPHTYLNTPTFSRPITHPNTYKKIPPLDKLIPKIGSAAEDPTFASLIDFIRKREKSGASEAALPNLSAFSNYVQSNFQHLPPATHWAVIDLVRVAFIDTRVSSFFAEEKEHGMLLTLLSATRDISQCPYNLRLVMVQLSCNLFISPLYPPRILDSSMLRETLISLSTNLLNDTHSNIRVIDLQFRVL